MSTVVVAELGAQRCSATLRMPSRVGRRADRRPCPRPRDAEQHQPADAGLGRLGGGLAQRVQRVLDDAGHRGDRDAARRCPRVTNIGSTRCRRLPARSAATSRRSAGVDRAAGAGARAGQSPSAGGHGSSTPGTGSGQRLALRDFLRGGGSAPSARSRAAYSASASTSGPTCAVSGCTSTRRPNSVRGLGGLRADARRRPCARAACRRCRPGCARCDDEVKQHRVEAAAP